jgi:DNA-directed RNA polymerase specialized sigma24 family protein
MGAAELTEQVASKDPEVGLAAVAALRRLLTDVERLQVDNARSLGWSWAEIARVLGVTRQSVHEKHRARRKAMGLED